jgi:hypothetical protein
MIISRSILLKMRNVSDRICNENQNTFYVKQCFFRKSNLYEIMWENPVELERPQIKIWRMCITLWITKATKAHSGYSDYIIFIPFTLQQLLQERVSKLPYTYNTCIFLITSK